MQDPTHDYTTAEEREAAARAAELSPYEVTECLQHDTTICCLYATASMICFGDQRGRLGTWDLRPDAPVPSGANALAPPTPAQQWWSRVRWYLGHRHNVSCLDMVDSFLVSGSMDRTVRLWDKRSGECLLVCEGHTWTINAVQLVGTRDGDFLFSASDDTTLRIWSCTTGDCVRTFTHDAPVHSLEVSGPYVLAGLADGAVVVWHVPSNTRKGSFRKHAHYVSLVRVVHDEVTTASWDGTVQTWDLHSGVVQRVIQAHASPVLWFHDVGPYIISSSLSGEVCIRHKESGHLMHRLQHHTSWVDRVEVVAHHVITVSNGRDLVTWSVRPPTSHKAVDPMEEAWVGVRGTVVKQGYLTKQGGGKGGRKNWKRRYFVATELYMYYFDSVGAFDKGKKPLGIIVLADSLGLGSTTVKNAFMILLKVRTYPLRAASSEEMEAWRTTLSQLIDAATSAAERSKLEAEDVPSDGLLTRLTPPPSGSRPLPNKGPRSFAAVPNPVPVASPRSGFASPTTGGTSPAPAVTAPPPSTTLPAPTTVSETPLQSMTAAPTSSVPSSATVAPSQTTAPTTPSTGSTLPKLPPTPTQSKRAQPAPTAVTPGGPPSTLRTPPSLTTPGMQPTHGGAAGEPKPDAACPWHEHKDANSGTSYYYNTVTHETTWERPAVLDAQSIEPVSAAVVPPQQRSQSLQSLHGPTELTAGKPDAASPWTQLQTADGIPYYHNSQTQETRWEAPVALVSPRVAPLPTPTATQPTTLPQTQSEPALSHHHQPPVLSAPPSLSVPNTVTVKPLHTAPSKSLPPIPSATPQPTLNTQQLQQPPIQPLQSLGNPTTTTRQP